MKEENIDLILERVLKAIYDDIKDCLHYTEKMHSSEYDSINEGYEKALKKMEHLKKNVHSIEDLAKMDEETITDVFEYIQFYADNYVISPEGSKEFEKNMEEYSKIESLLSLFFDEDDEDENYECE